MNEWMNEWIFICNLKRSSLASNKREKQTDYRLQYRVWNLWAISPQCIHLHVATGFGWKVVVSQIWKWSVSKISRSKCFLVIGCWGIPLGIRESQKSVGICWITSATSPQWSSSVGLGKKVRRWPCRIGGNERLLIVFEADLFKVFDKGIVCEEVDWGIVGVGRDLKVSFQEFGEGGINHL